MGSTAHTDSFARDNLPPREQWPELIFDLPELRYPGRLNCATELLDRAIGRGWGGRVGAPDSLDALAARKPGSFANVDTAAEDVALIAFTSGTTGKPKGTVHFHRDVIAMCDCFPRSCLMPAAEDIFCGTPPLAFTFGLGGMLCFPMRFGASVVPVEKPTPAPI